MGPLIAVDDPDHPGLAPYRHLKDRVPRRRSGEAADLFVVEGKLAVRQALEGGHRLRSLLVDDHQVVASADLVRSARARGVPVLVGRRDVVASTVGFSLHRGVVAVAARPDPADPVEVLSTAAATPSVGGGAPLVAVLEGLNDHENIGALFRNAAAFGVAAVVLDPTCADPLYRRSVRVSSGHVLRVPFARLAPWPDGLDQLRAAGFVVAALSPRASPPFGAGPPAVEPAGLARILGSGAPEGGRPVALVVGAEGPGLSRTVLAGADVVVSVPMAPGVDSLNVATAAAIAFYELARPSPS